ncbi:Flp family type IVb pilin [Kordiimonas aquimaris]|uniref:Flp family type IVb pilin n=1 Tax=Kordiimonas aquimaris TaxID=707591 RepID=UPI0021CFCCB2|nr:Flp family type IVb pilin [Kordiimonas aquimaris]
MHKSRGVSFFQRNDTVKQLSIVRNLSYFRKSIDGATAVEYGLLAGLVALGIAGGLGALSDLVNLLFENVSNDAAEVTRSLNEN